MEEVVEKPLNGLNMLNGLCLAQMFRGTDAQAKKLKPWSLALILMNCSLNFPHKPQVNNPLCRGFPTWNLHLISTVVCLLACLIWSFWDYGCEQTRSCFLLALSRKQDDSVRGIWRSRWPCWRAQVFPGKGHSPPGMSWGYGGRKLWPPGPLPAGAAPCEQSTAQ